MSKMSYPPDQANYSLTDGTDVVSTEVDGGPARQRRDILNPRARVTASWTVDATGYQYLRAFYRTLLNGALVFQVDLILESDQPTTHDAYFVPGTFALQSKEGGIYHLIADLEVVP
jgi:hypothetical protein